MKAERRDKNNDKTIFSDSMKTVAVSAIEDIPVTTKHNRHISRPHLNTFDLLLLLMHARSTPVPVRSKA
jgi:hypothetical protein